MPNFNPLIQDLIGKMIQIDVEQRITIDNIKKHPAFYLHLPQGYIVPVPLPLPHIDEPIDPDEIQPQLLKVLKQIGYKNDEELVEDLKSKGQTMAKVFHYMLTRQTDRSQLPWEKARHYDIEADMGKEEMLPEIPDAAEQNLDIRIRQSDMSPGVYSLAKKADWAIGDSIMVNYDQENVIESIHMTSAQLMSVLQQIMNELKYEWFHPDDLSLLARTPQCTYFEFTCIYSEIDIINLSIRMNLGTPDLLQELMAKINTALHLQVIDQNDQILDVVDDNNDIEIQNND